MGKVITYIGAINEMDFQKDVILTPSYLAKWLNTECDLYYGVSTATKSLPANFRNVELKNLDAKENTFMYACKLIKVILFRAHDIECLVTFHVSTLTIILVLLLKLVNPKAKAWVLGDLNLDIAIQLVSNEFVFSKGVKGMIKGLLINRFFMKLDIYSLETRKYVEMFTPLFDKKGWKALTYFPCGWDEDNPNSSNEECIQKENMILSCARFGTFQKNTEMLLEALAKLDLNDWKVYLVGPITTGFHLNNNNEFEAYIQNYYKSYPILKDKVIFTGAIFDTKILFDYFKKAKVFVMTSRYEGFANVFSQARWNQCYIVSTDVGGACDMSNNWQYGKMVQQDNPDFLANILQNIIKGSIDISGREFADTISYNYIIPTYILPMFKKK